MTFVLGAHSLAMLKGVKAPLQIVVKEAIHISAVDFAVVQGLRSKTEAYINFGKGRTPAECVAGGCPASYSRPYMKKVTWLKKALGSKHISGEAVDLVVWRNGTMDWDAETPAGIARYREIQRAMVASSAMHSVPIICGIDWKSPDPGHYEL